MYTFYPQNISINTSFLFIAFRFFFLFPSTLLPSISHKLHPFPPNPSMNHAMHAITIFLSPHLPPPTLFISIHSAFFACSLKFGAVPSLFTFPFSRSTAHRAAPTVFVKAKKIEASGTSSSKTVAMPKLHIYINIYNIS